MAAIAGRVAASLFGSYAFVWGFTSLGTASAVWAGLPYGDAQTLFYLLAFVVFLVCFCWAFVGSRLLFVWALLGGGGACMTAGAWLLTRTLS